MRTLMNSQMNQNHQSGAVLIVGLMILLLTTMVAISSMQNSNLQEKMASNSQEANRAFQAAESASDSQLNNIMGEGFNWILTAAVNQYLSDGTNWPTTTVSLSDDDISTGLQLRTISEDNTTCGNSITAEAGASTIPCYLHQLTTTASLDGSNATLTVVQGFTTR